MNIITYKNTSENNVLSKSITQVSSYDGTLRDECSITNPVIQIAGDFDPKTNYLYIPDFGRYYYITDITSVRNGLFRISASVDVLMSFKDEILQAHCIARRSASKVDAYLQDDYNMNYSNPYYVLREFPNGFDSSNDCMILTTC